MKKRTTVRRKLLKWFERNGRIFPWRRSNINIYKLLACEIFLWKTQAPTVACFTGPFFRQYSTPGRIERTPVKILAKDMKKLGLSNRRARLLKQTFSNYSSRNIPKTEKEFRNRFKVGQYIARSVLAIYYDQKLFPVDQNIYRFFKRIFNYKISNVRKISSNNEVFLRKFFSEGNKKLIWAMIDFASLVCAEKKPKCDKCILNKHCYYFKTNHRCKKEILLECFRKIMYNWDNVSEYV